MKTNYALIKEKIQKMSYSEADKYNVKMYENGLLTISEFQKLDSYLIDKNPIT